MHIPSLKNQVSADEWDLRVNPAGFTIHSCIHEVREDAACVLHTHSRAGVAVSAQKAGVLPLSQQSTLILGLSPQVRAPCWPGLHCCAN